MRTPWGTADHVRRYRCGAVSVSTPSHGGYLVPRPLFESQSKTTPPDVLRVVQWLGRDPFGYVNAAGAWFEEDCLWAVLVLAWPALRAELAAEAAAWCEREPESEYAGEAAAQYTEAALVSHVTRCYGPELVQALGHEPAPADVEAWQRRKGAAR